MLVVPPLLVRRSGSWFRKPTYVLCVLLESAIAALLDNLSCSTDQHCNVLLIQLLLVPLHHHADVPVSSALVASIPGWLECLVPSLFRNRKSHYTPVLTNTSSCVQADPALRANPASNENYSHQPP